MPVILVGKARFEAVPRYSFYLFKDGGQSIVPIEHECSSEMIALRAGEAIGRQGIRCEIWLGRKLVMATTSSSDGVGRLPELHARYQITIARLLVVHQT